RIADVRGLASLRPGLAGVFAVGLVAVLGLPPFSLFASELGIVRAGLSAGQGWVVAAAVALVLVGSAAMARHGAALRRGRRGAGTAGPGAPCGPARAGLAPLAVALVAAAALGLTPGPLDSLRQTAAAIITGH